MKIIISGSLLVTDMEALQKYFSDFFESDFLVRCNKEFVIFYTDDEKVN